MLVLNNYNDTLEFKNIITTDINGVEDRKECLWLYSGDNKKDDLYLGYINGFAKCFEAFGNAKLGIGNILMLYVIAFAKKLKFKTITLNDQANKKCIYNKFNQDRSVKRGYILMTGTSWYGSFGFEPMVSKQIIFDTIKLFNSTLKELQENNILVKEHIEKIYNHQYLHSEVSDFDSLTKKYLKDLLVAMEKTPEMIFGNFNKQKIIEKCIYEKVITDLISDCSNICLLKNINNLGGFSYYEKMILQL